MKLRNKLLVCLVALLLVLPMAQTVSAASNPYPTSQTVGGVVTIPCTYYAWQQAYDRLGIALPAWGNAINWYSAAANAGYSVGTTARANSIAVWSVSGHSYGHVAFVTAVNGSQMTINEGGRTDATANGGIVNGQVLPSTVNSTWYGRTLIGFVYLSGGASSAPSLSWVDYADMHQIGSTNAVLAKRCNLSGVTAASVSRVGLYLYNYNNVLLDSVEEGASIGNYSFFNVWFNVNSDMGYTLRAGTPYKYKFAAVINGTTYYSPVFSFTTTGSHSHAYSSQTDATCNTCGYTRTLLNGWVKNSGKWYYYQNGKMVTSQWVKDSSGWCWLSSTGVMATSQWVRDSKGWCYVGSDGHCWTNRWAKDSVGWVWLDSNGSMVYNRWIYSGGKWYYLDGNGYMVSNQWRRDSKGWCWLTASGAMATNQWVRDSKGWCYVGSDGYCWTNRWARDSVGWVWLNSEGSMVYNRWIKDGGKWYYIGSNGYMLANTSRYIGGKTYYFNASGVCTNP